MSTGSTPRPATQGTLAVTLENLHLERPVTYVSFKVQVGALRDEAFLSTRRIEETAAALKAAQAKAAESDRQRALKAAAVAARRRAHVPAHSQTAPMPTRARSTSIDGLRTRPSRLRYAESATDLDGDDDSAVGDDGANTGVNASLSVPCPPSPTLSDPGTSRLHDVDNGEDVALKAGPLAPALPPMPSADDPLIRSRLTRAEELLRRQQVLEDVKAQILQLQQHEKQRQQDNPPVLHLDLPTLHFNPKFLESEHWSMTTDPAQVDQEPAAIALSAEGSDAKPHASEDGGMNDIDREELAEEDDLSALEDMNLTDGDLNVLFSTPDSERYPYDEWMRAGNASGTTSSGTSHRSAEWAAMGEQLAEFPLSIQTFMYDSVKVKLFNGRNKYLGKCKLRIQSFLLHEDTDGAQPAIDVNAAIFSRASDQPVLDKHDRVVGVVRLRLHVVWHDADSDSATSDAAAARRQAIEAARLANAGARSDSAMSMHEAVHRPAGGIARLVRSLPRMSLDSTRRTASLPGSGPSTPATELSDWPGAESVFSSAASLASLSDSDHLAAAARGREFGMFQSIQELVHFGKSFFGEGWAKLNKREVIGAMLLMRRWAADPMRQIGRPRAPLHQMAPDIPRLRRFQQLLKYSMASYGRIGLSYFGYNRSDAMYKSEKALLVKFLDLQDENVLMWEMTRTGSIMAPLFFMVHVPRDDMIVLCIRGTFNIEDSITDLLAYAEPFLGGLSHGGFRKCAEYVYARSLATLREALAQYHPQKLMVTGHSMGGSTAHLAAMMLRTIEPELRALAGRDDFALECVTFASPPSASADLAAQFPDFITVVNDTDLVPRISYAESLDFKKMLVRATQLLADGAPGQSFSSRVGARMGVFNKGAALAAQMAQLDVERIQLGGVTPLADTVSLTATAEATAAAQEAVKDKPESEGTVAAALALARVSPAADWTADRLIAGPEVNVKLVAPGAVYYLMRSNVATTVQSPNPITGKVKIRRRPKPHYECWVSPPAVATTHGIVPQLAMLDVVVAPQAMFNHTPDAYDRALSRAILWSQEVLAGTEPDVDNLWAPGVTREYGAVDPASVSASPYAELVMTPDVGADA
ncbi:hypothetical protein AMAG_07221 [Allomyces macrogynus ATCC 38327]|uniref:Fungal lipase-type domain-containing protein n=1 Tax=Allomyces macrogynus (strain ATCC 38327) TaxID=578462 RepID=A0A0L0SHY8_ALLM3|nr:hypothetical protein AMAG_07221 [Allomyces macrogynus ATCC 38327]|eukprot:KNE61955.1 hypothetical protein AMAG_07221 [Allomyces macrogynus ATCC 38327]